MHSEIKAERNSKCGSARSAGTTDSEKNWHRRAWAMAGLKESNEYKIQYGGIGFPGAEKSTDD